MTDLEALVSLNMISDVGSVRLKNLIRYCGGVKEVFKASRSKLANISGIGETIANSICSFKKEDLDKELALSKKLGLKIITINDAEYPENLKNIYDPPIVLYLKGQVSLEDKLSLAIVGSRQASFYGLSAAQRFASDLASSGLTVVSGMARGIDTAAHRGALKAKGRTIAVIGSGFNNIYPRENKNLAEDISQNGAVISEFPINALPLRQNFPRRNRVISGLSLGVLVIEAARNSGALITTDFALEQGREVFALPGKVDSLNSFGTNNLIKQGAKLVENSFDVIEELSSILQLEIIKAKQKKPPERLENKLQAIELTEEEKRIYQLISQQPAEFEEIIEQGVIPADKALNILTFLELKGLVQQLPGKAFKIAG